MNNTLNDYINRTNTIINYSKTTTIYNKLNQKNTNEFKQMITYLEKTLKYVISKYEIYITPNVQNRRDLNISDSMLKLNNPKFILNASITPLYSSISQKNINLQWIQELNQFHIKINNLSLYGNIGNIYDKKILKNDRIQAHQVVACAKQNNCNNILSQQYCKFWHDPINLLELKKNKIISDDFYYTTIKYKRNFASTTWIYTSDINLSNTNLRSLGSAATLPNDLLVAKLSSNRKVYIDNMKAQVMHDLLILVFLSEHGLA